MESLVESERCYRAAMARSSTPQKRQRGHIERLRSGALRVKVFAGHDPVSKRKIYLTETVPPGPRAAREAEKVRTRLLGQVDEKRNPRTRATVNQLLDRWLTVVDVESETLRGYQTKIRKHIRPLVGSMSLTKLDVETLDSFYAELRRCRDHCDGKPQVQHRTRGEHRCDEHRGERCSPVDPANCRACRRACKPHVCKGLSDSTVRQVHWILSGALDRAVVWKWISVNPAEHASKPALPHPDPHPPSADEAARLAEAAWAQDPAWGAFVWTMMTTGARRGEICALRWSHLDLDKGVASIRHAIYVDPETRELREKDTKTHQQRRVVLFPETVAVLISHRQRVDEWAAKGRYKVDADGYVFSPDPDGSRPLHPDTATQRYKRMAERLKICTTLKNLRHYSATELISSGVDVRTVAGRLGHGGGGATTLRVYTAWSSEADQRAAATMRGRIPDLPSFESEDPQADSHAADDTLEPAHSYQRIAADLRSAIACGALRQGMPIPAEKDLAARYAVAASTAHRAVAVLVAEGLVVGSRGRRATVAALDETADVADVLPLDRA
jgi:integrase